MRAKRVPLIRAEAHRRVCLEHVEFERIVDLDECDAEPSKVSLRCRECALEVWGLHCSTSVTRGRAPALRHRISQTRIKMRFAAQMLAQPAEHFARDPDIQRA